MNAAPHHVSREAASTDTLAAIRELVVGRTGLAYYRGRERAIARPVRYGVRRTGAPTLEDYLALIGSESGRDELEALISELVIGETSFFRHPAQFAAIEEEILPALAGARPAPAELRIWSAACANGAEAASLALACGRNPALRRRDVSILATDVSRDAIRRARRLVFAERERRGLPAACDRAAFEEAEGGRRLAEPFRRMLRFRQHNLLSATHPEGTRGGPFDLVLCRNVLIYFDAPTVRRVLANIRARMAPDGWLLVGHAEPLLACHDLFRPEWIGAVYAYRPADHVTRRRHAPPAARLRLVATPMPAKLPAQPKHTKPAAPLPLAAPPDPLAALYALMRADLHDAAEVFCRDRLAEAPFEAGSHYLDAMRLDWAGESDEAETALRRALFLDRKFGLARFRLSQLLMARGNRTGALRELRNVLRLYDRRDAAEVASEIDGLTVGALRDLVVLQLGKLGAEA